MAATSISISSSQTPVTDSGFSPQVPNSNTGPVPVLPSNVALSTHAIQPPVTQTAAIWTPMTTFDEDLKSALVNWIDTTKEGIKVVKDFAGRTKTMDFFFTGTSTKSVRPDELGHFKVSFKYPPNINVPNGTTSPSSNTSTL